MSVVTSRTSLISILKLKLEPKEAQRRVSFKIPSDIGQILIEKKNNKNTKNYEDLVCSMRDSELSDESLTKILDAAKKCIVLLDNDLRLFVQALLILRWAHRSSHMVDIYQDLIINLVSAHPEHCKYVIDQFVKLFLSSQNDPEDKPFTLSNEVPFTNVHKILQLITKTVPLTSDMLISSIKSNFPFYNTCHLQQQSYMLNTLKVLEYLPHYRREILSLFVDRLLNLDVNASYEEEQFGMDDISNPIVESLDYGMELLFTYFNSVCRNNDDIQWFETKSLFLDLLEVLDKCILNSYGSNHVQFLLFYFVSFKSTLVQGFLNTLWERVLSLNSPAIIRKMSVAYIASFLARANFIPNGFLKTYLSEMTSWVHRYINNQDSIAKPNHELKAHSVFYGVCQAIFYVIAFRHRDLVDSRKKLVFLESLNLSKIITCSLNPLLVCASAVVDNFAAIARDHQLAYCYTIMENNERCYLNKPVSDAFFPFDPYLLKRSNRFIAPLYRDYNTEIEAMKEAEVNENKCMDIDEGGKSIDDEDDFIADSRTSDKHQLYNFTYSTSPGFKQLSV